VNGLNNSHLILWCFVARIFNLNDHCQFTTGNFQSAVMKERLVLGIMSGTSIDGVDYALCRISSSGIKLRALWSARFPEGLGTTLHAAARGELKSHELAQAHHDLGRFYARHAIPPKAQCREVPALVGLHGQTVFHNPASRRPATLQLGEPAYLVERLRVPVVSNFRAADMAAGGQGAPLATVFHQFVFARRGQHVCVNNLGGISNVTSLDWREGPRPAVLAFDTGPANVLIDLALHALSHGKLAMDRNGLWAARGTPCEPLLRRWLEHDYFRRKPPKSTGRELFGEPFLKTAMRDMRRLSPHDKVATLTEFTARSIALNYWLHLPNPPSRLILAGGGAANPTLVSAIKKQFASGEVEVLTNEVLGWPVGAIEPAAFALLAHLRMEGRPGNLPQTTGACRSAILGMESRY
jgi:anhydro-N-acetylmuramic acid kinase